MKNLQKRQVQIKKEKERAERPVVPPLPKKEEY